ncbi:hypothetical protein GRAQ_00565 [Rahnella aquatilis CIP 78.65 = ATCC 33071]|uniref:Uncharacterized protein n=1 Tax=Rahnella aquatilis (strain ATCC 33071 / DSM 4594 / JCM 1683 / NBRC 105701 / NCIMB 13365 / CIP 78.65) TaxID=745277 RepID=H2IRH3_RAHAC|nr:hypothetical protein [Rahnella aquatilis]AEX51409.1 hypothetical protein Rahaq2_1530 [Rahnella aquatilis CIP 78.65 = ATCC 33071]KFD17296.1 hypothetical protein GRAQ_00565 [Rahnella aquatilis CIP 78.65 = ATCC 33071]
MANYISGNIISQSYIHVNPKWLSGASPAEKKEKIARIEAQITSFAESRIPFFIGNNVHIEVEFSEGSIIAKITAYGKILPILGGLVVAYPQFSEGVRTAVKDAHDLGSYINSELLFQTEARYKSERKSVEARLGVFGTIDRVNGKINELRSISSRKNNSLSATYKQLLQLHDDILVSLDKISSKAIDDSDADTAREMWLDGVLGLKLSRTYFRFNNVGDPATYKLLIAERESIIADLKKRKK